MKRLIALLLLCGSSSGCMLFDDMMYHDDAPPWGYGYTTAELPAGTCGQPLRNVSALQTAEPELR
ncbi:MAG: hypothetical protein EXR98_01970 [Gemmataceae bacterium]|nr:hypothetical protein [Gemmataceae bacterium]